MSGLVFTRVCTQGPLSVGFSRQESWSELPYPPPGDLPDPGTEPRSPVSPALQVESLPLSHLGSRLVCSLAQITLLFLLLIAYCYFC